MCCFIHKYNNNPAILLLDDVVLRHTYPAFTGLGLFCSSEHFWTGCPSCRPPMTFTRIRTRDLSSESRSSKPLGHGSSYYLVVLIIWKTYSYTLFIAKWKVDQEMIDTILLIATILYFSQHKKQCSNNAAA